MNEFERFLKHFEENVLPEIRKSAITVAIGSDSPDAKLCCEVGAAVLLDKPIITVVRDGAKVSANLKRFSSAIVELSGDLNDPRNMDRVGEAISKVLSNDARARKQDG